MSAGELEAVELEIDRGGASLAGEAVGEGPPIVALHGLTANRRYVVHGSRTLPRKGYRLVCYDARGHGASDPAGEGEGYTYAELAADLGRVVDRCAPGRRVVLAGHSMGAHTLAAYTLAEPDRVAAVVIIGPTATGEPLAAAQLEHWDRLASAFERGGVEGFLAAYEESLDPEWRETVLRFTRSRLELHRHPGAVVRALREVPRSQPFSSLAELAGLDVPALVVASRDDADPGHPSTIAEAWARELPKATLTREDEGQSPLAWQGGRLSREIAAFLESSAVASRLAS